MSDRKKILNAERALAVAAVFLKERELSLAGPDIHMTVLDRAYDRATTDLCRRLASNPDLDLAVEPREIRALLCWRILLLIKVISQRPESFPPFSMLGSIDDRAARSALFEHVLSAMSLHAARHGKLLVDEPVGGVH